jgi:hypothetical protein
MTFRTPCAGFGFWNECCIYTLGLSAVDLVYGVPLLIAGDGINMFVRTQESAVAEHFRSQALSGHEHTIVRSLCGSPGLARQPITPTAHPQAAALGKSACIQIGSCPCRTQGKSWNRGEMTIICTARTAHLHTCCQPNLPEIIRQMVTITQNFRSLRFKLLNKGEFLQGKGASN